MALMSVTPEFKQYEKKWPIRMRPIQAPPAKFVCAEEGQRMDTAIDSMVSPGCIVSGARVRKSVLAPFVRINSYSDVDASIVMPHSVIGRYSRVRRAIIDEGVVLPENSSVGYD